MTQHWSGEKRKELKKLFKDISTKFSSPIIFTDSIRFKIKNQFNQANYQLYNIEAAKKICSLLGVLDDDFYNSISTFKGASKRLEIIYKGFNNLLIRDFAHSPSKLKASVNAVRGTFSNKFLIAVFELHTFSSLDPKFIQQYSGCLDNCDLPIIFLDNNNKKIQNSESINDEVISSAFNIKNLIIIKSNIDLFNYLTSLKYDNACLLLMSSGNFGLLDLDDIKKYMNNEC